MASPPEPSLLTEVWNVGKYVGVAAGSALISGIASYFVGRATKKREMMSSDLTERAKEFRELVASIEKDAIDYWKQDQTPATADIGNGLPFALHRMQSLRVYCGEICAGFGSDRIRELEDRFWEAVSGGDFQGAERKADNERIATIRHISADLNMAALKARRADFFLFPPKS